VSERRLTSGARGWALAGAATVALFVLAGVLGEAFGGEPHGPVSSAYATDGEGLAAWASLLARNGHPVRALRTPLARARVNPAATVVVLDPEALLRSQGTRLLAFVNAGGRLLIGGSEPQRFLTALLEDPPQWHPTAARRAIPSAPPGTLVAGVSEVRSAGEGAWEETAGYRPLLAAQPGGPVLLERHLGRGTLWLLADSSILQNRLLASADNAQLGLNIGGAPPRPVVFVESVHGFGESRGLAALPGRWWAALTGLLLAGLLWALARARRLGPPEPAAASLERSPARREYVEALALLLRRAAGPDELAAARARMADATRPTRLRDRR
jgi:hypothetical protein